MRDAQVDWLRNRIEAHFFEWRDPKKKEEGTHSTDRLTRMLNELIKHVRHNAHVEMSDYQERVGKRLRYNCAKQVGEIFGEDWDLIDE